MAAQYVMVALQAPKRNPGHTAAERRTAPPSAFAMPQAKKYWLDTPGRTKNALARLNQMFDRGIVSAKEYKPAYVRIMKAYGRFGLVTHVPPRVNVPHLVRSGPGTQLARKAAANPAWRPSTRNDFIWSIASHRVAERADREDWMGGGSDEQVAQAGELWETHLEREKRVLSKRPLSDLRSEYHRWELADRRASYGGAAPNPRGKVPATVERYHAEHLAQGKPEGYAWALAWSRYCKHKRPGSPHCKQASYFHGRGPKRRNHHSQQPRENPARAIPHGYIQWAVGNYHVSTADEEIRQIFEERCRKAGYTPAQSRKCGDAAIKQHHRNIDIYNDVMGGRIGRGGNHRRKSKTEQLPAAGPVRGLLPERNPSKVETHVTTKGKYYYVLHHGGVGTRWIQIGKDEYNKMLVEGAVRVPWSHGKQVHHKSTYTMSNSELGVAMQHWHAGQGDPIYAVGSTLFADRATSRENMIDALGRLEGLLAGEKRKKERAELREIIGNLEQRLAYSDPDRAKAQHAQFNPRLPKRFASPVHKARVQRFVKELKKIGRGTPVEAFAPPGSYKLFSTLAAAKAHAKKQSRRLAESWAFGAAPWQLVTEGEFAAWGPEARMTPGSPFVSKREDGSFEPDGVELDRFRQVVSPKAKRTERARTAAGSTEMIVRHAPDQRRTFTQQEAHDWLTSHGFHGVPGSSRYESSEGGTGRIVGAYASGRDDQYAIEITRAAKLRSQRKLKAKSIELRKLEGTAPPGGDRVTLSGKDVWSQTRSELHRWSAHCPPGRAYDKVQFVVTYSDGQKYEGRLDLHRGDWIDLGEHMRTHLEFLTGEHKPAHLSDAEYQGLLDLAGRGPAEAKRLLAHYEMGIPSATPGRTRGKRNPSSPVADTILRQLGGANRLRSMIGAQSFVGDERSLTIRFKARAKKQVNCLRITLEPNDTYTVDLISIRNYVPTTKATFSEVYVENLRPLIERETGLYLSL